jgi:4'-phosphopantetheinyl transferase EntD
MDADALLRAWRRILPASVSVCAGPFLKDPPPLSPAERRSAGEVGLDRLHELENGRHVARRALALLGVPAAEIPVGDDRSPRWPDGIVGSITHATAEGGSYAAAAVARASDVVALGIDAEGGGGLDPRLWGRALTRGESERLLGLPPPSRPAEALALWCVKEAVLKAARRRTEPAEIEVERASSPSDGETVWRIRLDGTAWEGRSARVGDWVLAAVAVGPGAVAARPLP